MTYRTFSQVEGNQATVKLVEKHTETPSNLEKFPMKLHRIIERCEIDGYSHIISWMPHGRSFKIHDRNDFSSKIMLRYFYITKFTSFIRQLTLYGFHKCSKGADKGSFYHELFLIGMPALSSGIIRSTKKKRKLKLEPDLYNMPYLSRFECDSNDNVLYVPSSPRKVQYHLHMAQIKLETIPSEEVNSNTSRSNKIQKFLSFEYFHKSQSKSLFSIYG